MADLGGGRHDQIDRGMGRDRVTRGTGNDFNTVNDAGDVVIELASPQSSDEGLDLLN
jgi:hypothetical protein